MVPSLPWLILVRESGRTKGGTVSIVVAMYRTYLGLCFAEQLKPPRAVGAASISVFSAPLVSGGHMRFLLGWSLKLSLVGVVYLGMSSGFKVKLPEEVLG